MGNRTKFNLGYVRQFKMRVRDDSQRHTLIGLAVYLGSHSARKEGTPQNYFTGKRDMTSKIYEAEHIARAQSEVLRELGEKSNEELIEELRKRVETSSDEELNPSELSKALSHSRDYQGIGKRVETRLGNLKTDRYKRYAQEISDRESKLILIAEEEAIRSSVIYELKK